MPRVRNYPHTRQEWEDIRPLFTRLYKVERKKLSEIVQILKEKGFHAREVHYKRRIHIWGLDKKKKELEMAFAACAIAKRHDIGKDTRVTIRGDIFTPQDVEKYWKRKVSSPEDIAIPAGTPTGIEYGTPAPSPAEIWSVSTAREHQAEVEDSSISFIESFGPMSIFDGLFTAHRQFNFDDEIFCHSSMSPSPVMTPASHRTQESALFYAQAYYQVCMDQILNNKHVNLDLDDRDLSRFFAGAVHMLTNLRYDIAPWSARAAQLEIYQMIPSILAKRNLKFIWILLALVAEFNLALLTEARIMSALEGLMKELIKQAALIYPGSFPLVAFLKSISDSFHEFVPCSKMLLEFGEDFLTPALGAEHDYASELYRSMYDICWISGDWARAMRYAKLKAQS